MKIHPAQFAGIGVCTVAAVAVHGYHPYVEDAAIYVPGIKKVLDPTLFPYNQEFFASHASMTLFPNLIAGSSRLTHLPLDWVLLLWHVLSIFFLLLASWRVGRLCFQDPIASWGGTLLVAALLTLPVAGTSLYLMDQYLTPRSFSTPLVIWIVVFLLERNFVKMGACAILTAAIHPLMAVFGLCFAGIVLWPRRQRHALKDCVPVLSFLLPVTLYLPVTDAYREVLRSRSYFFISEWKWYEWMGILGPMAIVLWFGTVARSQKLPVLASLCRGLIAFQTAFLGLALLLSLPGLAGLGKFQPMRSLHLLYILLLVFAGGWLAQSVLGKKWWRWAVVLVPLCAGMYVAQRQIFPASRHLELPGRESGNSWVEAFLWIRANTPASAYFALDPDHMELAGEDEHGFRAIAERSMLADRLKDSGAVSMFPALAEKWREQVRAETGWKSLNSHGFQRLHQQFNVDWVVVTAPASLDLLCPYQNALVAVCKLKS